MPRVSRPAAGGDVFESSENASSELVLMSLQNGTPLLLDDVAVRCGRGVASEVTETTKPPPP